MQSFLYKFAALLLGLLMLTGCTTVKPIMSSSDETKTEIIGDFVLSFITIGKGDAFLLETPNGNHFLVDTGKTEDYRQISKLLRVKNVDSLDGIVLTHGHKDHAGCLDALLAAFPTKKVYISKADTVSYREIDAREISKGHKTEIQELVSGEKLDLGGVEAEVWIPRVDTENANNNSVILRITHGDNAFLLMGDAEYGEEMELLASEMELDSDVLKLGHHGEDDATSPALLEKVRPKYGIISGNFEENPDSINPTITKNLKDYNVKSYISKSDGLAIDFVSNGKKIDVLTVADNKLPCRISLSFGYVSRKKQTVEIRNDSADTVDLSGCMLLSEKGNDIYIFPWGAKIEPGAVATVTCAGSGSTGDFIWNINAAWSKKNDRALLYDRNLNLLAEDSN